MNVLLVALGAAVGAPARYLTDRFISARHDSPFPWGTFAVNMVGTFLLGLLVSAGVPGRALLLVGTGFCGALTTYSTFGYETVRLAQDRARVLAFVNAAVTVLCGLGAAYLGALAARLS